MPLLLINYSTFKLLNDGLLHLQTLTNVKTPITATTWDKSVLTNPQEIIRVFVSRGTIWTKAQESVLPINHHYKLNFWLVSIPTVHLDYYASGICTRLRVKLLLFWYKFCFCFCFFFFFFCFGVQTSLFGSRECCEEVRPSYKGLKYFKR